MNLLLVIRYPNYFARIVVKETDTVLPAIETTNNRIPMRMCENVSALNRLGRIMSGEIKPLADYLAGNNYFGKVIFKYTRSDGKTSAKGFYELSVKVYSALGATVEEHDERYKRIKSIRYQNSIESNSDNV